MGLGSEVSRGKTQGGNAFSCIFGLPGRRAVDHRKHWLVPASG